jgi:tRNA1Val (adenine37-N6)-methyltransferase
MIKLPFHFKKFSINQDRCAMKVGTDGILLGSWADISQAKRILDIGTGTGLLALMAAQRNAEAWIDAIELDEDTAGQAKENIEASPWSDRMNIFHAALQEFYSDALYDRIICNPPFYHHGVLPKQKKRLMARMRDYLSFDELLEHAGRLMNPKGKMSIIIPFQIGATFMNKAQEAKWYAQRIHEVKMTPEKPVSRLLLTITREILPLEKDEIVVQEGGCNEYSAAYRALTEEFYQIL